MTDPLLFLVLSPEEGDDFSNGWWRIVLPDIFDAHCGELSIYPTPRFRIRALTFGRRSHPSARGGATSASLLRSFPVAVRICPLVVGLPAHRCCAAFRLPCGFVRSWWGYQCIAVAQLSGCHADYFYGDINRGCFLCGGLTVDVFCRG